MKKLPRTVLFDDVFAAADMGLWQACDSNRCPLDAEGFQYYARTRIVGAIQDELRREDWNSRYARQNDQAIAMVYDEDLIEGSFTNPNVEETIESKRILEAFHVLSEREKKVLTALLNGAKQREVALEQGCSEPRICQIMSRIRQKLKAELGYAA